MRVFYPVLAGLAHAGQDRKRIIIWFFADETYRP